MAVRNVKADARYSSIPGRFASPLWLVYAFSMLPLCSDRAGTQRAWSRHAVGSRHQATDTAESEEQTTLNPHPPLRAPSPIGWERVGERSGGRFPGCAGASTIESI